MLTQYKKYFFCFWGILYLLMFMIVSSQAEPVIGKVTSIEGKYIELDIGADKGIEIGDTGRVFYKVTIDGKEKTIYVAKFKITHTSPKSCMAIIEDKTAEIRVGNQAAVTIKVGGLEINSEPSGAKVYVDGKEMGETPLTLPEIKVGKHQIRAIKEGYEPYEEQIEVTVNEKKEVTVSLKAMSGSISIQSEPTGALILFDKQALSIGSHVGENLTTGSHNVWILKEGYIPWQKNVSIEPGKRTEVRAHLKIMERKIRKISQEYQEQRQGEDLIKAAYNIIFDNYVIPLSPSSLLNSSILGIQNFLVKEQFYQFRFAETLFVSSSEEVIEVNNILNKASGADVLEKIYRFTTRNYPQANPLMITYGAIKKMVEIDPHSTFMEPRIYKEVQAETKGRFEGCGIEITIKENVLKVVSPIENSPAYKAGIMSGDEILKINGEPTKGVSLMEAVKKMRGSKGTKVTLTVMRSSFSRPQEFILTRDIIPVRAVRHELLDKHYGYIRISQFQERTDSEFQKAIKALEEESSGSIRGLILDLRNNPGGLLDQAVKVADYFIESGIIVSIQGRKEEQNMKFYAHSQGTLTNHPLVVLVNGGSAAGSEILGAALQDHKRALILGNQTFGKGSVQTLFPLPDGSALRLTTALYSTPNGYLIQKEGIVPDLFVITKEIESQKLPREEDLEGALPRVSGYPPSDRPKIIVRNEKEGPILDRDGQLRIALQILKRTSGPHLSDLMLAAKEVAWLE